jgi:hypothetical protein
MEASPPSSRPTSPPAEVPSDREEVLKTFRLGWTVAELRGRYRPGLDHVRPPPVGRRVDHALPLSDERSTREQEIQLHEELARLSSELDLDHPLPGGPATAETATVVIARLGHETSVARHRDQGDHNAWEKLTEVFYDWDTWIQDTLLMQPVRAAAYQLGRALAETYWALDPAIEDPHDWRSWGFLLGRRRSRRIKQLIARLSGYVDPLTPSAVWASVDSWTEVASNKAWRGQSDARETLYDQGLIWRDLVRGEQRPSDLTHTRGEVTRVAVLPSVLKLFRFEIALSLIAVVILVGAAASLSNGDHSPGNTVAVILSGLGLTAAGLFARAKAVANSLLRQLSDAVTRAEIARAATCRPNPPIGHSRRLKRPSPDDGLDHHL